METDGWKPRDIDLVAPNVARMYDYYLGGKDNFEVDRAAAAQILELAPFTPAVAQANRGFLRRATQTLAASGIRQFLDIGTGLPTRSNVHELAQAAAPGSRVVYLDNDPIVVAHGRALIDSDASTLVREHDLRRPEAILADPDITAMLDFGEPIGLMLLSVLHCLRDEDGPYEAVATLLEALAPGSYVVISHVTGDDALTAGSADIYSHANTGMTHRTREQQLGFFKECTLLDPGLVRLDEWRPDAGTPVLRAGGDYYLCGVGRKGTSDQGEDRR